MKTLKFFWRLCLLLMVPTLFTACGDDEKSEDEELDDLSSITSYEIFGTIYDIVDELGKNLPTGTLTNYKYNSKFGSGYAIVNGTISKDSSTESLDCKVELVNFSRGKEKSFIACTGNLKFTQSCLPNATKKRPRRNVNFTDLKVRSSKISDVITGALWNENYNDTTYQVYYKPYSGEATGKLGIKFYRSFSY